jgi:hypothetical protein
VPSSTRRVVLRIVALRAATAACVFSDCALTGRRVVAAGRSAAAARSGVSAAAAVDSASAAFTYRGFVDFGLILSGAIPDFAVLVFADEAGLRRLAVAGFARGARFAAAGRRAGMADRGVAM